MNIDFEQDGAGDEYQRPVLIVKGMSANTCVVVPLTTSSRRHRLRIPIGNVDGKQASALMSQIRIIDTKRLVNKVGFIEKETFESIRKTARGMF